MSSITVALTSSSRMSHVPLAALGYTLRRAGILDPLTTLEFPMKTIEHTPVEKLTAGLVLILAGGRALYQANWLLRPNASLAWAWGQAAFAEQSTISDTFDAVEPEGLQALQTAFATITRNWSRTCHHDFRRGDLILDGDLTGLPASRHAASSRKGYFAGKKTAMGGNWPVSPPNPGESLGSLLFPGALIKAKIAWNQWCV
jgi:hypothetical protein